MSAPPAGPDEVQPRPSRQPFRFPAMETLVAVVTLLLIFGVPPIYLEWVADDNIKDWKPSLVPTQSGVTAFYRCEEVQPPAARPAPTVGAADPPTVPCREFLPAQREVVKEREKAFLDLATVQMDMVIGLLRWQYLATVSALIAGALTAAALLAVSFLGWTHSALWTKVFFMLSSVSAAFWFAVPQIYKYEHNIASAFKRYNTALSALQQIEVVRVTGRGVDGKWIEPHVFLWALSAPRVEANGFVVEIDQSKAVIPKLDGPN